MDRRQLLARLPLYGAAVALPTAAVAAAGTQQFGLPLAGDLADQMVKAMAHPSIMGRWEITIRSGDLNQCIAFRQIAPPCRLPRLIDQHQAAYREMARTAQRHDELKGAANIPVPKVVMGTRHPTGSPIHAYRRADIEKFGGGNLAFTDAFRAKKLEALRKDERRYRAAEVSCRRGCRSRRGR